MLRISIALFLLLPTLAWGQPPARKRTLTHADQDIWNTATGVTLSPDGAFLGYTFGAPNADAVVVLRNIATGTEVRTATGSRVTPPGLPGPLPAAEESDPDDQTPPPAVPAPAIPTAVPPASGVTGSPTFTPDSRFLYFPLLPTKAEVEKARADKKKPEEMPKAVLAVLDVKSGQIVQRIEKAKSFRIVGEGAGILVLVMDAKPELPATVPTTPMPMPTIEPKKSDEDQRGGGRTGGGPAGAAPPRITYGTDLVLKNLADGKEATFADVQDSSFTKDFKHILYTVNAKKPELNGLYFAEIFEPKSAAAIKAGVGRYFRITWNQPQTQLAFFFDEKPTAPPAPPPVDPANSAPAPLPDPDALARKPRVYLWERTAAKPSDAATTPIAAVTSPMSQANPVKAVSVAKEILGPDTPGLLKGWQIVDRGGLSFSDDGLKLSVSAAPIPETAPPAPVPTPAERAAAGPSFDMNLWHWKDEAIQPMQKVRAAADRNKSYRCVYFLDSKQFRHLVDNDRGVSTPNFTDWGLGSNDLPYRAQTWNFPNPSDYAFVNIRTGESKPLTTALAGAVFTSPHQKSAMWFDGQHWFGCTIPDGKPINLTEKLKVKFVNEEYDMPSTAPSYGFAGWSPDDRFAYLYDRFDIWRIAVDGSSARNITEIGRAQGTRLRLIRVEKPEPLPEDKPDYGLDATKPWLLAAENTTTRDTGFYRLLPNGKPQLLLMGARKYGTPTKAKNADTHILTVQTFQDFPDYYATGSDFKEVKKLTDINPKVKEFNWGTAELVAFKSTDGTPLQGILVKPEDFDPSKKYPMIVYIYERLTDTLHNFRAPTTIRGQVINPTYYASNGYLVFMPDIAYKTGLPGQSAMKCILPGIQAVVDQGCVNESAIGINGQSWGGYQIAYMVTQTDRFKAAVAGAAVTNMVSAYNGIRWGTGLPRQFQYEKSQSRLGESLWASPFKYLENSPIFMADRVTTPLLMINNDADDAVPWYQGIEYFLALRRLNKEVYMLNYNGQPHNLSNKNAARDFAVRMQQFFDHHLKGEKMPTWMEKGVPYLEREKEKEQWKKLVDGK